MEWLKSSEHRPRRTEIVWGYFKNRDVELVQLALQLEEYEKYFDGYYESSWYSLDSEKCGSVDWWTPLEKPKPPEEK